MIAVAASLGVLRASHGQASCESQWIDRLSSQFSLDDTVFASTVFGGRLCIGGEFGASLGVPAHLAMWEPGGVGGRGRWIGIGGPPNARVTALAELDGRLYAAGMFTTIGGVPANRIAVWDPAAGGGVGAWSALGSGLNGGVETMLGVGGRLYVGGSFTIAGGGAASRIAVWDPAAAGGAGAWSSVGIGTNGTVWSLAVHEAQVVVGGDFTVAGGVAAARVARLDPSTGIWSSMGVGFNDIVRAVHVGSTGLHVGGDFTASGAISTRRIARWDPTAGGGAGEWVRKGSVDNGNVLALGEVGGVLHAAGTFDQASGALVRKIAAWDPTAGTVGAWVPLGGGTNQTIETLTTLDGELHVGGRFLSVNTGSSSLVSRHLATWVPSGGAGVGVWRSADRLAGFNNSVFTAAMLDGDLYVGGEFTSIGDTTFHRIARWRPEADGGRGTWESVGGGMNQSVFRLLPHEGRLYAVGRFTQAGGVHCNHVAVWDPQAAGGAGTWSPLGTGLSDYGADLAWLDGDLYVCGAFGTAGGIAALRIARWDPPTATWSPVGGGFDDVCGRLIEIDGSLWAAGSFTTAGGTTARRVARWTPAAGGGGTWSEVAGGTNDTVSAIDLFEGRVHIGGRFTEASGSPAHAVAVLDPTANGGLGAWQPLGAGISVDGIHAIAAFESWEGRLVVGGEFDMAGGLAVDNLAAWDPSTATWSAFGGGLGNVVHDLMPFQNRLLVTGKFIGAGDTAAYRIAEWGCAGTSPVTLAMAVEPSTAAVSGVAFPQQPRVRLLDSAGDPVDVAGVEIVASIASGGGTLLGTTSATTATGGVATFADLAISGSAGDRTLAFTAAALPDAVLSSTVTVSSPCPSPTFAFGRIRLPATARRTAVDLAADAGCDWSASTAAAWISLTPSAGTGDGRLSIAVETNSDPTGRTATITVSTDGGDVDFELVQTGSGRVVAWGLPKYGLDQPPPGLAMAEFVAVGSNRRTHGAIRDDGTVAVWGLGSDGQLDVPGPLEVATTAEVVDLAVGPRHVVALRDDGTVVAWGRNVDGQCEVPPGLLADAVAAGRAHSAALRRDGTVVAWGRNQVGQCDVPAGLDDVIAISAGDWHTLALRSDGTVIAWGDDTWGQATVPAGLASVEAISAGRNHSLALRSDGTVTAWGDDRKGQSTVRSNLQDPSTADAVAVAAGRFASFALRGDGSLVVFGMPPNGSGTVPPSAAGAVAIAAGDDATVAIVPATPAPLPPAPPPPAGSPPLPATAGADPGDRGRVVPVPSASPAFVRVPEDRATLGDAVALVADGGTVLVGPGVHAGSFAPIDRAVTLRATHGPGRTAILGDGTSPAVVVHDAVENDRDADATVWIEGFSIVGGAIPDGAGGGVRVEGGRVVLRDCVLADNRAAIGAGLAVLAGEAIASGCEIVDNDASVVGGGVAVLGGRLVLRETVVRDNIAPERASVHVGAAGRFVLVDAVPDELDGLGKVAWSRRSLADRVAMLVARWGPCPDPGEELADRNGDGVVDAVDLALLLSKEFGDLEIRR
jgi:hypothetical protein